MLIWRDEPSSSTKAMSCLKLLTFLVYQARASLVVRMETTARLSGGWSWPSQTQVWDQTWWEVWGSVQIIDLKLSVYGWTQLAMFLCNIYKLLYLVFHIFLYKETDISVRQTLRWTLPMTPVSILSSHMFIFIFIFIFISYVTMSYPLSTGF